MRWMPVVALAAAFPSVAAQQPVLLLQGEPFAEGMMTLHVSARPHAGEFVWITLGLDPLPLEAPELTAKGGWFAGFLLGALPIGVVPPGGLLQASFSMPALTAGAESVPLVLQALVASTLSNPATLALDEPFLLASQAQFLPPPLPAEAALFGDSVAAGDFNADGAIDLAVGAWHEDVDGVEQAGRVYVLYGPTLAPFHTLQATFVAPFLHFGHGLVVADFSGDGVDDLGIAHGPGGDPPLTQHGNVFVLRGGAGFPGVLLATAASAGTGVEAWNFGRTMVAGDLDADGSPDLVVGAPGAAVAGLAGAGRLEVFAGPALAAPLVVPNPEPTAGDAFGTRAALGDVGGDGALEIVESSGSADAGAVVDAGCLHVFAGATLDLLLTLDDPEPVAGDRFGEALLVGELWGGPPNEIVVADASDHVHVLRDVLGALAVYPVPKPPTPNPTDAPGAFGSLFGLLDANGDGALDLVIADPSEGDATGCGLAPAGGAVYAALAPYFATFRRLGNPQPACGEAFGWGLLVHDLDGDGAPELIAGNTTADAGALADAGCVVIVSP